MIACWKPVTTLKPSCLRIRWPTRTRSRTIGLESFTGFTYPGGSNQDIEKMWCTLDGIVDGLGGANILGAKILCTKLRCCVKDQGYRMPVEERKYLLPRELTGSQASFQELENAHVNYDTVQWCLISCLFILVYGVGLLLLLYVPVRRYIVRKDIQNRELYVTTQAVVYKVRRPVFLPCCGVSVREKHVLLHLVTDMAIEEGCIQSCFGVSTIRVENAKLGWPAPGNEMRIQGVVNPRHFKQVVLMASAKLRQGNTTNGVDSTTMNGGSSQMQPTSVSRPWSWQQGVTWQMTYPNTLQQGEQNFGASRSSIMRKLEGLESSLKRIELLIDAKQEASPSQ